MSLHVRTQGTHKFRLRVCTVCTSLDEVGHLAPSYSITQRDFAKSQHKLQESPHVRAFRAQFSRNLPFTVEGFSPMSRMPKLHDHVVGSCGDITPGPNLRLRIALRSTAWSRTSADMWVCVDQTDDPSYLLSCVLSRCSLSSCRARN